MTRAMQSPPQRPGRAPRAGAARPRLLALAAHYDRAAAELFLAPAPAQLVAIDRPPRAGAGAVVDLSFPSLYQPTYTPYRDEHAAYAANLTARARLYAGAGTSALRPVAVCLHGWGGGRLWLEERAFAVSYLLHIGLDVVLFQLPFHGERTPVQAARSGALFPGVNLVRTNEAFGQAVSDLRALAAALRARGAPAVGALGMSLGAYTAALWAGLDPELSFCGALIPAVSMADLFWTHGAGSPARRRAEREGVTAELLERAMSVHAPLLRPALIGRERLFIAGAHGDRITPPEQAERLWRHWGEPTLVWFAGGHVAQLARGDAFRALRRWLCSLGYAR